MKFLRKMILKEIEKFEATKSFEAIKSLSKSLGTVIECVHVCFNRIEETNKKLFKLEEDLEKIMDILTNPMPLDDQLDLFEEESSKADPNESEEDKKKRLN